MNSFIQTMMMSVISSKVEKMAASVGISNEMAKKAVAFAVPMIMSKLADNTASPEGKQGLFGALAKHGKEVDLDGDGLDDNDGHKIATHVFGDSLSKATKVLGKQSGATEDQANSLMNKLLPLVMGGLSKEKDASGLDADGISSLLGTAKNEANEQSGGMMNTLMASVLDKDGDGDVDMSDGLNLLQGFMKS